MSIFEKNQSSKFSVGNNNCSTGDIILRSTPNTPDGFLKCNSATLKKTTYSALYSIIGDSFNPINNVGSGRPHTDQYGIVSEYKNLMNSWSTRSNLSATNIYFNLIVTKNRAYILGRYNGVTYYNNIYTATISSTGILSSWTTVGSTLPSTNSQASSFIYKDRVYLIGGYNGAYKNSVYTCNIQPDGVLGTWTTKNTLPFTVKSSQILLVKNRLYIIGGFINGACSASVYSTTINADGTLGSWSQSYSMPYPVDSHEAILIKDRLYVIGGESNNAPINNIIYAHVDNNGNINGWVNAPSLPITIYDTCLICSTNKIYLLGGKINSGASSAIYSANINLDGGFGDWELYGNLLNTRYGGQALVTSSSIYILGGYVKYAVSNIVEGLDAKGGIDDFYNYYSANSILPVTDVFTLPDYTSLESMGLYAYIKS